MMVSHNERMVLSGGISPKDDMVRDSINCDRLNARSKQMLGGFAMNLTLKQLFKSVAVCLCACALNATATDYVSDSFEAPDGSLDLPISQYKYTTYEEGLEELTNYVWLAAEGDASAIVATNAAYADFVGDGPISNETSELVLNLDTEGNTLSRTAGVSIVSAAAYIDTLIQFTPSEDDPEIDAGDAKIALYVNAQSNLVVHHLWYDSVFNAFTTNSIVDGIGAIDPDAWYRLSMQVSKVSSLGGLPGTKIYLDGTALTHTNAYTDAGAYGGEWFLNLSGSGDTIEMVSFQGTGMLDEFVVSDEMPIFPDQQAAIMLTLVGDNVAFSDGGTPVTEVESGTEVLIEAADWYVINALTGPSAFTTDASGSLPADSLTVTLNADASCSVTAETAVVSSGNVTVGDGAYPAGTVAAWAMANDLGEGDVEADMEDDYLLNVAPDTDATIQIDSFVIDGSTVTIIVSSSAPADVEFDGLNGTVKLYSSATLGGTFNEVGSATVDDTAVTTAEVEITLGAEANPTDFFKVVVE
jgi:hypothetical protein